MPRSPALSLAPSRLLALVLAALALGARPSAAAPPDLTAEEFKLYSEYQAALTDERVQKMPEAKRLGAIAKNFKVSEKALSAAIARGEKAGAGVAKACEAEARAMLEAGALKGLVREVNVDAAAAHVVTYVSWTNMDGNKLEEEASAAALAAATGAPITSTVAVWAVDTAGKKVFEAKISASAASRFKLDRIPMFATKLYIKSFEDVKNAYKGTPPAN
jgi:hypothetical protein